VAAALHPRMPVYGLLEVLPLISAHRAALYAELFSLQAQGYLDG